MKGKLLIYTVAALLMLTACHNSNNDENSSLSQRTVLVYMSGENNLSGHLADDLSEMLMAKTDERKHCLLAYVDDQSKRHMPYLVRIKNGHKRDSVSLRDMGISKGDTCSADPAVLKAVINYAFRKYPSETADYGLVLWGHATGWVVADSIGTIPTTPAKAPHRAYGVDDGTDQEGGQRAWINIYSLAEVLREVPHLRFIFADCCNFMCLESLYALRGSADYIIGSPAEIPDNGAPYMTVVPAMFEPDSFYTHIVDRYYEREYRNRAHVPLSVVKTSAMATLADATRQVILTMKDTLELTYYPNTAGLIHYYRSPLHHDANDFILRFAKTADYTKWKEALDEAVIYKKMSTRWVTDVDWTFNYGDFTMTEERYGGVSMFVPQNPSVRQYYGQYNADIRNTAWYHAVGLQELDW